MRFHLRFITNFLLTVLLITVCIILFSGHGTVTEDGTEHVKTAVAAKASLQNVSHSRDGHVNTTNQAIKIQKEYFDLPSNTSNTEVKLIILTYMRSGSSFTGDLFNHHDQVFYVFEPLWSVQKHYFTNQPVFFYDKPPVYPKLEDFYTPESLGVSILKSFLDCQFRSIDPRTLIQYHMMSSETTKTFFSCFKKRPGISGTLACLPSVARPCRAAKVTSVKTIRFFMKQAAKLVKDDPKVKVLHLLRDPRGTLRSQASVAEFKWNDLNNASRLFCDRVYRDLQEAERLKTLFPGRVLTARYEDLATDPMAFAEKLLTFAGLTFSPKLRDYVWKITSSGLSDGGARSTVRNNSQATANSWRKKVAFSDSSVIDTNCLEVYKRTGYLAFPMEVFLKNLTFPSFVDHKRVPGLWT